MDRAYEAEQTKAADQSEHRDIDCRGSREQHLAFARQTSGTAAFAPGTNREIPTPAERHRHADTDVQQMLSAAREREAHLRQAQAFEARAKLEREMAARQTNPTVRAKLLEEANQLSAQAARERELISEIK